MDAVGRATARVPGCGARPGHVGVTLGLRRVHNGRATRAIGCLRPEPGRASGFAPDCRGRAGRLSRCVGRASRVPERRDRGRLWASGTGARADPGILAGSGRADRGLAGRRACHGRVARVRRARRRWPRARPSDPPVRVARPIRPPARRPEPDGWADGLAGRRASRGDGPGRDAMRRYEQARAEAAAPIEAAFVSEHRAALAAIGAGIRAAEAALPTLPP